MVPTERGDRPRLMGEFEASVHRRLEEAWGGVNWGVPGTGLEQ